MTFAPETYRDAAAERLTLAAKLYASGEYVFAIYAAGLAVECILRAYRTSFDPEFDARHVLVDLYRQSKFAQKISPAKAAEVGRAITDVSRVWRNDHRFRSEKAVRQFLNQHRFYHGVKGDVLKEQARRLVNNADVVVSHGVTRWER